MKIIKFYQKLLYGYQCEWECERQASNMHQLLCNSIPILSQFFDKYDINIEQDIIIALVDKVCWQMAITYTRAVLNMFSQFVTAKPLSQDLWVKLTKLHILRFQPTCRGKQARQRKQRSIPVIVGRGKRNTDFSSFVCLVTNFRISEEHHLHKLTQNQLNIQVRKSSSGKTNNIGIDCLHESRTGSTSRESPGKVPNLMVANVMPLVPKVDKVREFIFREKIDLVVKGNCGRRSCRYSRFFWGAPRQKG